VPYIGVGTGQWKKAFTGKGNASKQQVAAVAMKLRPGKISMKKKGGEEQSDEADAIGILFYGLDAMKRRAA
jgi:Holliday junction resolvasome RuvABC endonuclease subunit